MMKSNYEKLKDLLAELFQLDQADLDLGTYRIMNQKRGEITRFLEKDLLPQVQKPSENIAETGTITIESMRTIFKALFSGADAVLLLKKE